MPDFSHWYLSIWTAHPMLTFAGTAVAAVVVLFSLKGVVDRISAARGGRSSRGMTFFKRRKIIREAEYLMDDGSYHQAGALLDSVGEYDLALQAYLKGDDLASAAMLAVKIERFNQAASIYRKLEEFDRAAELYGKVGQPDSAREMHLAAAERAAETGKNYIAAEMYVKAEEIPKAADMYAKSGDFEKAAVLFERAKLYERAGDAYEILYSHTVSREFGSTTVSKAGRQFALSGARAFENSSNYMSAARLYAFAGEVSGAAEMLSRAGDDNGAAEMLLEAKRFEEAAKAFRRAENENGATRSLALKAVDEENFEEAARLFEKINDHIQAAALYERLGMTSDAGRMFEAANEYMSAASMFVAAGDWERAAENYEKGASNAHAAEYYAKAGKAAKAAPLFKTAGLFFEGGKAFMAIDEEEEAMSMFQRIRPSDEHYDEGSNLLGQLFVKKGRHGLAIKKFLDVLKNHPITLDNVGMAYNLARAYESTGQPSSAKLLYEKIILVDFNYKDANARLSALEKPGSGSS